MPSFSLSRWETDAALALDEVESAHRAVGGSARGRRHKTQQLNHLYAILLSSQFQAFCRDLHSEAVDHLTRLVAPQVMQPILRTNLTDDRKLDRGNPSADNIGSDFGRFGLGFWAEVYAAHKQSKRRRKMLDALMAWRNAIAHHDFNPSKLGGKTHLQLGEVQGWRRACRGLARTFDSVMRAHIAQLAGSNPW